MTSIIKATMENYVTVGQIQFAKSEGGRVVTVSGTRTVSVNPSTYASIGTLPSEYRPSKALYIPCQCGNALNVPAVMRIQSDGDVSILGTQTVSEQFFVIGGSYLLY